MTTVAEFFDVKLTARQAADRFAETHWDEPRKVGCFLVNPTTFSLVDGATWYRVELIDRYAGWRIVRES